MKFQRFEDVIYGHNKSTNMKFQQFEDEFMDIIRALNVIIQGKLMVLFKLINHLEKFPR